MQALLLQQVQAALPAVSLVIGPDSAAGAESRTDARPITRKYKNKFGPAWGLMRLMNLVPPAPPLRAPGRNDTFAHIRHFIANGGISLEAAFKRLQAFNGLTDDGAIILYAPGVDEHIDHAFPPTEANLRELAGESFATVPQDGAPYLEFFKYATCENGRRFYEDVVSAITYIRGNVPLRFKLRLDLYYTAVNAQGGPIQVRHNNLVREAYAGKFIFDMPWRWPVPAVVKVSTQQTMQTQLLNYIQAFMQYTMNVMPGEGSNKVLTNVLCCKVYCRETESAGPGNRDLFHGRHRTHKKPRISGVYEDKVEDAFPALPDCVHDSPGLLLNYVDSDSVCLARACMTAVDEKNEANLDTNWVVLLREGVAGARARIATLERAKPSENRVTLAAREILKQEAQSNLKLVQAELEAAEKTLLRCKRHVRDPESKATEQYKARGRSATIERELQKAFKGEHRLFDFQDPLFHGAVPLNADTIRALNAAVKTIPGTAEPAVKIQIWMMTTEGRVGLVYPADGATLQYLRMGGMVINLLFAHNHVSAIKNVTTVNHANPLAGFKDRVYCGLCGEARSYNKGTEKWSMYEHQLAGCPTTPGVRMQRPKDVRNFKWLGEGNLKARNLPSMVLALGGAVEMLEDGEFAIEEYDAARLVAHPGMWSDPPVFTSSSMQEALGFLCDTSRTAGMQASVAGPVSPWQCVALPPARKVADGHCGLCKYPLKGPSAHAVFLASSAVGERDEEGDDTDSDFEEPVERNVEEVAAAAAPVDHTCPFTGETYVVHAECHAHAGWTPRTVYIEVSCAAVMAAAVDFLFLRTTIETFLQNNVPSLSEHAGVIRRVTFVRNKTCFTLRPRTAFFPEPSLDTSAMGLAVPFAQFCTEQRAQYGLWPGYFGTVISYARALLFDLAADELEPGTAPTSLCDRKLLEMIKARMLAGGRLVMGERAVMQPDPAKNERMFFLDVKACYPTVLSTHALPFDEANTYMKEDFTGRLLDGLRFLDSLDVVKGDECFFLEVSGYVPEEKHAAVRGLSPIYGKLRVGGKHLSVFQRKTLHVGLDQTMLETCVGHLLPLDNALMFAVELKAMMRNHFRVTEIRRVWACAAKPWGRPFAATLERTRKTYEEAGDKVKADATKLVANSVIGALGVNPDNYKRMAVKPGWPMLDKHGSPLPSLAEYTKSMVDNNQFMNRTAVAGDCVLFECTKRSWTHTGSTLAWLFVQAVARSQLLDVWYGAPGEPGIRTFYPDTIMGYGATDSLSFMIKDTGEDALRGGVVDIGCRDPRHALIMMFRNKWDLSNVPLDSTVLTAPLCREYCRTQIAFIRKVNAHRWGGWSEQSAFAGLEELIVNGPNRYAWRACKHETDTPAKLKEQDVLKGIPLSLQDGRYTVTDFGASLDGRPELPVNEVLALRPSVDRSDLGHMVQHTRARLVLSKWRNLAVVVDPAPPHLQYPLGSREYSALALLSTDAYREYEAEEHVENAEDAELDAALEPVVLPGSDADKETSKKRARDSFRDV